jgi:cytochrome P450
MKYLDQVIDETLRLYPPIQRTDRVASCDYTYEGIKINKGQIVTIPIYALHRDPSIYPNPDEFRPERFSDTEKKTRENVAYCPFGAGPRNCIGMRFAITEIKLFLASILCKFRFENCEQTLVISLFFNSYYLYILLISNILF